jgi:hypothetical protein
MGRFDAKLDPEHALHQDYVRRIKLLDDYFRKQTQEFLRKTVEWWDLFLAIQEDTRDPVDESWRSDVFVPLPFTTTRTKAAQLVEIIGNTEPVWQVEATREEGAWYEQSKHIERLLEYIHRENRWRRFLYKLATNRSVQGTVFFKTIYSRRAHRYDFFPTDEDQANFQEALDRAVSLGAPKPPDFLKDPDDFEKWRSDEVNKVGKYGMIPAPPIGGMRDTVEYEGPVFQQIPLWAISLDPFIDELRDQKAIIHTMVKPLSAILARADNKLDSPLPYIQKNIETAMGDWNGEILQHEQRMLAESLGLNPMERDHPYFDRPVKIQEVWSFDEEFKYTVIMNDRAVINKRPFEHPLLTTAPNIHCLRNIVVPGHFYGLSDYQEPEKLFKELNTFRRIRMDGATLTTLPVFVKQAGVQLTEALRKLKPGMILTLPTKDAIQSLIRHTLPAEAYREPQEIKFEIDDAVEVPPPLKGAQATIGRVTGTEFTGRQQQSLMKYKVDAGMVEEELMDVPAVCLSLMAQLGPARLRKEIGGDPDALVDVTRDKLVQALGIRFRMRGATKNIDPALQIQQLNLALGSYADALTPMERRFALRLILEMLDIRGSGGILTEEGATQISSAFAARVGAENAANSASEQTSVAQGVEAPAAVQPGSPEGQAAQGQGGAQ